MLKLLLIVVLFAVVVYAVARAIERRGLAPRGVRGQAPRAPLAPDDDPEFLRNLDQQRWEQRQRQRRHDQEPQDPEIT